MAPLQNCNEEVTSNFPNCLTTLATISEHLKNIDEKLDTVIEDYDKLNKDINIGNGKPPIKERLTLLEDKQSRRQNIHAWILGVIALVLAGVCVERVNAHLDTKTKIEHRN